MFPEGSQTPVSSRERCSILCPSCGKTVETSVLAVRRTLKKRGRYSCSSCIARSPEGREARSRQSKKAWLDPEIASSIALKSADRARSPEGREARSRQSKKAWLDPSYRSSQTKRAGEMFRSDGHKLLVSERNKAEYMADPEKYLREKTSALRSEKAIRSHAEAVSKPEYKALHRDLAVRRFEDPSYRARIASGLDGFPRGGKKSSPEKAVEEILKETGVEYSYGKPVGPYNFDFYVRSIDLFIEVQGEYWHTLPNNERRDRAKYSFLRSSRPSSKIIYIWDYEISSGQALRKISEALGMAESPSVSFSLKELEFYVPDQEELRRFLCSWHYAQNGKKGKYLYAARHGDLMAAGAKIGPVSRREIAEKSGGTPKNVFELDRFCIHPMRQKKNFGSFFLKKVADSFFQAFPEAWKIVSFSDTTFGHTGSIYRACGWTEEGRTRPDYVYVREDGWMMHKKSLYNQAHSVHMTESEYAENGGWKKVFGKEKIKFSLVRKG